jgi:hypothetical protein
MPRDFHHPALSPPPARRCAIHDMMTREALLPLAFVRFLPMKMVFTRA